LRAGLVVVSALVLAEAAGAREAAAADRVDSEAIELSGRTSAEEAESRASRVRTPLGVGTPFRLFGGLSMGRGMRFNNPYRLQTELGDDAESLSLTATYADVQVGIAFGGSGRFSHGGALHASFALDGVPQQVLAPSYLLLYRLDERFELCGRAGLPVVLSPQSNVGFELAGGGIFHLTAALGVTASLVGSLFYGAATLEAPQTAIPIASLELGLRYDYEVLP
jgi:hypothetical protein